MKHLINFGKGLIVGSGLIAPGVSGSVLAIVLGIYDKLIYSVSNFRKNVKENTVFLLPILFGIVLGVIGFSKILLIILKSQYIPSMYVFMGLIIGSIPKMYQEMQVKSKQGIIWIPFLITLAISIVFLILEENYVSTNIMIAGDKIPYVYLFICGILFAIGKVVPGLSSSALLIMMGMYEYYLSLLSNIAHLSSSDIKAIIPFALGTIISLIVLVKLMNYLFTKHYRITMSIIFALIISSLLILFPGIGLSIEYIIGIILFIAVFFITKKVL